MWSEIIISHSEGEEIWLKKYRTLLIELFSLTYFRTKVTEQTTFKIESVKVGQRKVKMISFIFGNSVIKVSKQKMLSLLFPSTIVTAISKEQQHYQKVLLVLRQLIEPQIREFRQQNSGINWSIFEVDHQNRPFIRLVEDWLEQESLYYIDLKLKGPINKKYLTDTKLALAWQNYHKANAVLAVMSKSLNRSKGAEGWTGTQRLGSFKRRSH